jgi:hypothetical protein
MSLHETAKAYAADSVKYQLSIETGMRVAYCDGYAAAMQEIAQLDRGFDPHATENAKGGGNMGDVETCAYDDGVHYVCEQARAALAKATNPAPPR